MPPAAPAPAGMQPAAASFAQQKITALYYTKVQRYAFNMFSSESLCSAVPAAVCADSASTKAGSQHFGHSKHPREPHSQANNGIDTALSVKRGKNQPCLRGVGP
jgi:hypothetical protein